MSIQVYERFDVEEEEKESTARGCQLYIDNGASRGSTEKGDLWNVIEWDFAASTWATSGAWGWQLKCDWRMPAHGVLRFMNPVRDEAVEFRYDIPSVTIPHFTPGVIKQKSFTPELRAAWEALPREWSCSVGKMTLTCTKDIVDAIESSPLGELYLYRPTEIRIS